MKETLIELLIQLWKFFIETPLILVFVTIPFLWSIIRKKH